MAYIAFTNVSSDSFGAYIAGLDSSYSRGDRSIEWRIDGVYYGMQTGVSAYVSQTDPYWFYNLTSNTTYNVGAGISYTDGSGNVTTVWVYDSCTTSSSGTGGGGGTGGSRPDYFYWTYEKVAGGQYNLMASEWQSLQANINAVRAYKGFYEVSFTYVYSGLPFTASIYNECLYAIGDLLGYNVDGYSVSTGQTVTADSLNRLRDLINSV